MKSFFASLLESFKKILPANWQQIVGWAVLTAAVWLASTLGFKSDYKPPFPVPIFDEDLGWVPMPDEVDKVARDQPFYSFDQTPAGQIKDDLPKFVYLWKAYHKLKGVNPPSENQNPVGSCVAFGTCIAVERTMQVQIAFDGKAEEFKPLSREVVYAGSRVEVGGGRLRGDGSVGAWAAKFVKDWGVISREVHGKYDLTKYDPARCRAWGNSGVPNDLEPLAKEHPVQEITLIKTWDQAKKALAQGYGIAVCSGQGFEGPRDSRGVKKPRGSWAHCMAIDGYHIDADGKEYAHIENSWGEKPGEGPVGWGDPPTSGFWIEASVCTRMIEARDCWAFSAVKGFPAKNIDWFVDAGPRVPRSLYAQLMNPVLDRAPSQGANDALDSLFGLSRQPGLAGLGR